MTVLNYQFFLLSKTTCKKLPFFPLAAKETNWRGRKRGKEIVLKITYITQMLWNFIVFHILHSKKDICCGRMLYCLSQFSWTFRFRVVSVMFSPLGSFLRDSQVWKPYSQKLEIFPQKKSGSLCAAKNPELPRGTWRKSSNVGGTCWAWSVPGLMFGMLRAVQNVQWQCPESCGGAGHKPSKSQHSLGWFWFWFRAPGSPDVLLPCPPAWQDTDVALHSWDTNSFYISAMPQFERHSAFCQVPNFTINSHYFFFWNILY